MNSIIIALVAVLFFSGYALATTVRFNNHCDQHVTVIRTANNQQPTIQCELDAGQSCSAEFNSNGMNFKNGWQGQTLAEFSFNSWNNMDFYDLSVIVGYDASMQITSSTGGPTVTCQSSQCSDAYLYPTDDKKTHGTPTGGEFNVNFCP